ncbi:MAG: transposase family protein [Tannerella sp.]|nr:transposase family protein [Tannerella sp.]
MKKPKEKEITAEQKQDNRTISSFRVRVEHAIESIKRYRTVNDECRLRKNLFAERVFSSCAALHNFRIKDRPFLYENKLT